MTHQRDILKKSSREDTIFLSFGSAFFTFMIIFMVSQVTLEKQKHGHIQIAAKILTDEPTVDNVEIRQWALAALTKNSNIPPPQELWDKISCEAVLLRGDSSLPSIPRPLLQGKQSIPYSSTSTRPDSIDDCKQFLPAPNAKKIESLEETEQ